MLDYYNEFAREYLRRTRALDMRLLYTPFLQLLQPGARILDAGCGSGRDSRDFLARGYQVAAIDASSKMVAHAQRIGIPASCMRFQEMRFERVFEGIWACASLLHVPTVEMVDVLDRFRCALEPGGVMYVSFKLGAGERVENGRLFNDYDEPRLLNLLTRHGGFDVLSIWRSLDVRTHDAPPNWINALVRRRARCRTNAVGCGSGQTRRAPVAAPTIAGPNEGAI
jgi:SAM-dependent methyltransferase